MNERRQATAPGTMLNNRYRIENKIGSGGFSLTYKAVDIEKNIQVAIKQFAPLDETVEIERERERFIREARILREFDYLEGIVSIRDVFEDDNTAYLVMDYIDGITLKEYVGEYGTFSWDELVEMVTPVIRSLSKIHRRNVTHCDISPDNLMIGMDNKLWLIDFGASKHVDVKSERTVIIKQGYAPIEQYYSDGSEADGKIGPWTDVYAFSATMYMALTGEKPRTAVERLKTGDDSQERSVLEAVLENWQRNVLLKGMAVNKSDRYENMEEFLDGISFPPDDNDDLTRVIYQKKHGNVSVLLKPVGLCILLIVAILLGLMMGQRLSNKDKRNDPFIADSTKEDINSNTNDKVDTDKTVNNNIDNNKINKLENNNDFVEESDDMTESTSEVTTQKATEKRIEKVQENNVDSPDNIDWSEDDDELY